jgi:hypothetical protein
MLDHGDGSGQPGLVEQALQGILDSALTRDDILDNITQYWLTNTGVSSARLSWERAVTLGGQIQPRERAIWTASWRLAAPSLAAAEER